MLYTDTVTIDLASPLDAPTYRASGFIYGLFEDGTQPPPCLQSDIKVKFIRAGGAQLDCPNGGNVNDKYTRLWNSVKGYYARTKAIGANFVLLTHDLWGADAVCNVPRWPGDNGNWTEFVIDPVPLHAVLPRNELKPPVSSFPILPIRSLGRFFSAFKKLRFDYLQYRRSPGV